MVVPQVETASRPQSEAHKYTLPDINLLSVPKDTGAVVIDENALKERAAKLEQVLNAKLHVIHVQVKLQNTVVLLNLWMQIVSLLNV